MGQWEYRTIEIGFEHNEFVVSFTSGRRLYGLKAILDEFDARGWEYINMVPHLHKLGSAGYSAYPVVYIAFFRRPRTAYLGESPDHDSWEE